LEALALSDLQAGGVGGMMDWGHIDKNAEPLSPAATPPLSFRISPPGARLQLVTPLPILSSSALVRLACRELNVRNGSSVSGDTPEVDA
jgi:hypothetical protein